MSGGGGEIVAIVLDRAGVAEERGRTGRVGGQTGNRSTAGRAGIPGRAPRQEPVSLPASPVAFSQPMAPIEDADAGAPPADAVDPLDLGNGVRRLPPVE